ncbi:MAG: usg protein [Alphaproteobacteria bacterium]|nr:usg protein [Alphaproteobacteria bacterium]
MPRRESRELELMLRGYSLTTAEILYHLPDHPSLLQSYVWQEFDIAPRFPVLNKFLVFWTAKLEGKLHSVRVASKALLSASELKLRDGELTLH